MTVTGIVIVRKSVAKRFRLNKHLSLFLLGLVGSFRFVVYLAVTHLSLGF
jgi:hypothetical protein